MNQDLAVREDSDGTLVVFWSGPGGREAAILRPETPAHRALSALVELIQAGAR